MVGRERERARPPVRPDGVRGDADGQDVLRTAIAPGSVAMRVPSAKQGAAVGTLPIATYKPRQSTAA